MGTISHSRDAQLLCSIAREVNRVAGTCCSYWHLDRVASKKHPLYNEAQTLAFDPNDTTGIEMPCFAENPGRSTTGGEEGLRTEWDLLMWIASGDWYEHMEEPGIAAKPRIGDVVKLWGKYYDVVDQTRDGILDDERNVFVEWKITLKRRTKFEAKRRAP